MPKITKGHTDPENGSPDQRLLDIAAYADAGEGVRQGMEDVEQGKVRPVRRFFDDFEAKRGIHR